MGAEEAGCKLGVAARIFSISGKRRGFVKLHASKRDGSTSMGAELMRVKEYSCNRCEM